MILRHDTSNKMSASVKSYCCLDLTKYTDFKMFIYFKMFVTSMFENFLWKSLAIVKLQVNQFFPKNQLVHKCFQKQQLKIKSILIHEHQHKSTRVQHESTRVENKSTRVWQESTRINTSQHKFDTSQHESARVQNKSRWDSSQILRTIKP